MIEFNNIDLRVNLYQKALSDIQNRDVVRRIWRKDHTVWGEKDEEIGNRLGWLDAPERAAADWPGWAAFARDMRPAGITNVLLLGMGGSSLAPEVFAKVFGPAPDGLRLDVLDSTDPASVLRAARSRPIDRTLFLVSSKSGTTLETASLLNFFYARAVEAAGREKAGRGFAAITDPGSRLEEEARRLGFRAVFPGDPDIGGRFSVFSAFGLVPAALLGLDGFRLIASGREAMARCRIKDLGENPGARLGAALGALALSGRDKARFLVSPRIGIFGAWIEQLVAESTGKNGRGILPLVRDTDAAAGGPAEDQFFVVIALRDDPETAARAAALTASGVPVISMFLDDLSDLGGQFFLWEFATAVAGAVLGINPFDQPNVALSKKKTEAALRRVTETGRFPEEIPSVEDGPLDLYAGEIAPTIRDGLLRFLVLAQPGDYVALQAFLPQFPEVGTALRRLAGRIESFAGRPVTYDFGPRFLHSTGQLHKGDAGGGLFLQITADHSEDAVVPDPSGEGTKQTTFGRIIDAQALGDREALREKGRRVARLHLHGDPVAGLVRTATLLA